MNLVTFEERKRETSQKPKGRREEKKTYLLPDALDHAGDFVPGNHGVVDVHLPLGPDLVEVAVADAAELGRPMTRGRSENDEKIVRRGCQSEN